MNMQVSSVSKFPDKIYIGYPGKSEQSLLEVIRIIRETPGFSEEDYEFRGTDMFFVRPGVLPLLDCSILKSPLYSWDQREFKEMAIIGFEYYLTTPCWQMRLSLRTPSPDYQNDLISIVYNNDTISFYGDSGDNCLKLAHAMGLNKLKEYYERKPIWSDS